MSKSTIAEVVAVIALLGLPELLVVLGFGSLLAGFAIYSLISFITQYAIPLLILGVGVFTALLSFRFADENQDRSFALIGVLVLLGSLGVMVAYIGSLFTGGNTFNLLGYDATGTIVSSFGNANVILQTVFLVAGAILFILEIRRLTA